MENVDQSQDALFEALTIEKIFEDTRRPMYYWANELHEDWWGWIGSNGRKKDIIYLNKDKIWHRLYGPAFIGPYYDIEAWYKDGLLHRVDGPAYRHKKRNYWLTNGKLHRLDGPAVDAEGHPKEYWIGGQQWSPKNYKKEIARRKRKGLIK